MTYRTRRDVLAAAGVLATGLAGCLGDAGGARTTTDRTTDAPTSTDSSPTTTADDGVAWSLSTPVSTGPVVREGTVFVGDANGVLYALASDGSERWTYDASDPVFRFRVEADAVYVVSGRRSGPHLADATVHAVDRATGDRRWTFADTDGYRTPVLLGETTGVLGVGLRNDYLQGTGESALALDVVSGEERWREDTGDVTDGAAASGTLYAAEYDELTAFDPADGGKRWSDPQRYANPPVLLGSVPLLAADTVRAVDPMTGEARWTYGESLDLAGAVALGDRAYTRGEVIAALTADGTEAWRYDGGGELTLRAGDRLFGTSDGGVVALSTEGDELWTAEKPMEHFDLGAATDRVVAGVAESVVHVYDQATGERNRVFRVESDHSTGLAATAENVLVADETTLYALDA